jgi:GNAT superfamily N-acetyltransferase
MISIEYSVELLTEFSVSDAAEIGALMNQLTPDYPGDPIPEDRLKKIIESDDREQLVVRMGGHVVAAATVNLLETTTDTKLYLDNFVTDAICRRLGIGSAMMDKIKEVAREKGATQIAFTSNPDRTDAHRLYENNGANIKNTLSFRIPIAS